MWHEVARLDEIAAGGMTCVRAGGHEICLCEYEGSVYAVSRRCGHQNAPLDQGALEGGCSPVLCTMLSSTFAAGRG